MILSSGVTATGRTALAHAGVAGLSRAPSPMSQRRDDLEVGVAHDLQPPVALDRITHRVDRPPGPTLDSGRPACTRATDPRRGRSEPAVLGVVVLMRGLPGLERAQPLSHRDPRAVRQCLVHHAELQHLACGRVRHQQPPAVGRDAHVVGAVAVHLRLGDDAAGISPGPAAAAFAMSIHTTSDRLGRETATYFPSRVVNASSTYWSCPSPTACWIAR